MRSIVQGLISIFFFVSSAQAAVVFSEWEINGTPIARTAPSGPEVAAGKVRLQFRIEEEKGRKKVSDSD
jgi:hypothetical protein